MVSFSLGRRVLLILAGFIASFMVVPMVGFTIAQPWHVEGHSMEPALRDGSVLLVDAVGPRVGGYRRGDIVIVPLPPSSGYPHPILVKRIVGVAGDQVVIQDGHVTVNGVEPAEPYLAPGTVTPIAGQRLDVTIPVGSVFVMGDHRENSYDSKAFGPVPVSSLVGRAWLAVAPGGQLELPGAAAGSQ
jgi:signal peptidase I